MAKTPKEVTERMELEPCPFCKSRNLEMMDVEGYIGKTDKRYWVWCKDCKCGGPVEPTPVMAMKAWNRARR